MRIINYFIQKTLYFNMRAFSLIELLIAIVIIAIISLAVQPSWQKIVSKNRAQAYTNELVMKLRFVRATAIRLGKPVAFYCDRDLPPVFAKDTLSWNRDAIIVFSPDGFAGGQNRSFYYCPKNSSKNALAVILSSSGRVRVSSSTHEGKRIPCNL